MKSILIVDDDPDVAESVRMILQVNDYKVFTAHDGDECLRKVREVKPDLVLLDIMMPGTPVDELLKQMKDTKIAFMSIVRISDAKKRGLFSQGNIVEFFQKPFNVNDLVERIEVILNE